MLRLTIIVCLFIISSVFGGVYNGNVKELDTNVSLNFDIKNANAVSNVNKNFDEFNLSTTFNRDETGHNVYKNTELNNTATTRKLLLYISESSNGKANAILNKMTKGNHDLSKFSAADIKDLTNEKLVNYYTNSKRVIALQKNVTTIERLVDIFSSASSIKCYMKRKLSPSFYCPLSTRNSSYYTGGSANTKQEDTKAECDNYCQEKKTCVSMPINNFGSTNKVTVYNSLVPASENLPLAQKQELKSVKVYLKSSDVNVYTNLDIKGVLINTVEKVSIVSNYRIDFVNSKVTMIEFPFEAKGFSSIIINIYKPFEFVVSEKKRIISNKKVELQKVELRYQDNKYWFCPNSQFVSRVEECQGKTKSYVIGGAPVILCITSSSKTRESTYGAYYSKNSCENECLLKAECKPSYRHLNLSNLNIDNLLPVEVGCLKGNNNKKCTKDLCKEKIMANIIPNFEQVYHNDKNVDITVLNGQVVEGKERPKYNLADELATNNNVVGKKELVTSISKDNAYENMMNDKRYVISKKKIAGYYELISKATKIGSNGVSIEFIPRSDLFDTDKDSYVYIITVNKYTYHEMENSSSYPSNNPNSPSETFRSEIYTIIDSNKKYKPFLIKDKKEVFNEKKQSFIPYMNEQTLEKTIVPGKQGLMVYDKNSFAPYTIKTQFVSSKYKYIYNVSNAYLSEAKSMDGVVLKNQIDNGNGHINKIYTGDLSSKNGGTIYSYNVFMITSDKKLAYNDILNAFKNDLVKQIYSYSFPRAYTMELASHVKKNRFIKLYLLGKPGNMSAVGEFYPSFREENKEVFVFNFLYKEKK